MPRSGGCFLVTNRSMPFEFLPLSVTHQVPEAVVRERLWQRTVGVLLKNLR